MNNTLKTQIRNFELAAQHKLNQKEFDYAVELLYKINIRLGQTLQKLETECPGPYHVGKLEFWMSQHDLITQNEYFQDYHRSNLDNIEIIELLRDCNNTYSKAYRYLQNISEKDIDIARNIYQNAFKPTNLKQPRISNMDQYKQIRLFIKHIDNCSNKPEDYYGKHFELKFDDLKIEFDWDAVAYNELRKALVEILNQE